MKTLKQPLVILLCLSLSLQALSQTSSKTDPEPDIPNAFLRVGVQLPSGRQSNRLYKAYLGYERILSPRLTASATLVSGLRLGTGFEPGIIKGSGTSFVYHDVLLGLDLDLKYYLAKNKFSGHYFSLAVKDVAAYTRYSLNPFIDTFNAATHGKNISTLARVGIYYGYRKQFVSGWFIDGSIGYVPKLRSSEIQNYNGSNFDFKIGFGYTIPFTKKK
jgi:hypothetical protein